LQKTKWIENEFRGLTLQETDQLLPKPIDISVAPTLKKEKYFQVFPQVKDLPLS